MRRFTHFGLFVAMLLALTPMGVRGQGSDGSSAPPPDPSVLPAPKDSSAAPAGQPLDKRVFGVFPNYRTTDGTQPFAPITTRQKFAIGLKDSFDWPIYP